MGGQDSTNPPVPFSEISSYLPIRRGSLYVAFQWPSPYLCSKNFTRTDAVIQQRTQQPNSRKRQLIMATNLPNLSQKVTEGQRAKLEAEYNLGLASGKSWREIAAALGQIVKGWKRGR